MSTLSYSIPPEEQSQGVDMLVRPTLATSPTLGEARELEVQAKNAKPLRRQGSSGPLSAVVAVGLARPGDVTSKLTKGRYRSVA